MLTKPKTRSTQAARRQPWWRAHPLVLEIGVVLLVKVAALAVIWVAFFRDAPAPDPATLFAPAPPAHQETPR